VAGSGQLVFDMMEDLPAIDINAKQVDMRMEPSNAGCIVEAGGNHPLSTKFKDCSFEVNVAMQDLNEEDDKVLPPCN
jgi:hypothetical protein